MGILVGSVFLDGISEQLPLSYLWLWTPQSPILAYGVGYVCVTAACLYISVMGLYIWLCLSQSDDMVVVAACKMHHGICNNMVQYVNTAIILAVIGGGRYYISYYSCSEPCQCLYLLYLLLF